MTTFLAGQKVSAADLNNIIPGSAQATQTSDLTVTTTDQDVPGCSVTITTPFNNWTGVVHGIFDLLGVTGDIFLGTLMVDGVTQTGEAHYQSDHRTTVPMSWEVTIATAGSHTLKLRADKTTNTGTVTLHSNHTRIIVTGPGIG